MQQFVGKWVQEGGPDLRFEIKLVEGKLQVLQVFAATGKTNPCDNVVSVGNSLSFDLKLGQRKETPQNLPQNAQVAGRLGLRLVLSADQTMLQGTYASDLPLIGRETQLKRVEIWPPASANRGVVVFQGGPGALPPTQTPK